MPLALRLLIVCAAIAALSGCGPAIKPAPFDGTPVPVVIDRLQHVPVPDYLTAPLVIAAPNDLTCGECVRVARDRRTTLERCNADRAETRKLGREP